MILHWSTVGDTDIIVADKTALAGIYHVSIRTIERHCTPIAHMPKKGVPRGQSGAALYDALAAAADLETVNPRAGIARRTLLHKMERRYLP
jgi:hypothetical protein